MPAGDRRRPVVRESVQRYRSVPDRDESPRRRDSVARAGDRGAAVLLLLLRPHEPRAGLPSERDAGEGAQIASRRAPREPGLRTCTGAAPSDRQQRRLLRLTPQDRIAQDREVGIRKGRLGSARNEDVLQAIRRRQLELVLDPTVVRGVDRTTDDVFNFPNGSSVDRALDHVSVKSTRLNSSHGYISYAVFCLKKKKNNTMTYEI